MGASATESSEGASLCSRQSFVPRSRATGPRAGCRSRDNPTSGRTVATNTAKWTSISAISSSSNFTRRRAVAATTWPPAGARPALQVGSQCPRPINAVARPPADSIHSRSSAGAVISTSRICKSAIGAGLDG